MSEFRATYRLQLTPDFGFAAARELVPYLRDLGISHLYLSPSLQARAGSQHGYDVVDPRKISDALGGEEEFRNLADAGLGVILDIVPNHMAAVDESPFWRDLDLRQMFFDIDLRTGFHRRFFDVGELGGLKQEDWEVFWATHAKVIELAREGVIDGVRVDHPDGLADPAEYFDRLADAGVEHVWAEKILEPGEELRDWPVEGTTGYEFLNDVLAVCVNRDAEEPLTELYESFTGDTRRYEDIVSLSKLEVAVNTFEPELRRLHQEVATENLPLALASFHVYRTYIQPYKGVIEDADREEIGRANVSEELRRVLFLQEPGNEEFVVRFQQTTGPVMAKGVEDTAFYRYVRLTALNEVGGNPGRFGLSIDEFHAANEQRAGRFPLHMLTTYTHDTKRSPDVRSRIAALSWLHEEWAERLGAWHAELGGLADPHEELLVYQTLVGALPIERGRLDGYLEKALREGKVNTNWLTPNEEHERAVQEYAWHAAELMARDPFLEHVRALGRRLSLAQLLLKLTSPGLPDIYRGDELEDLSLVDPDNRRPVDWAVRRDALRALQDGAPVDDTNAKLYLTWKTLGLRAERASAFAGTYEPLDAGEGVCAFVRGGEVLAAAAVRPGATVRVPAGWHDVLGVEGLALCVRPAREALVDVV
ncbi:MAG TPA: alpha-amylase family glycosyl hydrolase [Gaiellaceae bacterium]|nr:alpha-amylase family glycosyl hydrolase [Gaiellaceae bacterium]